MRNAGIADQGVEAAENLHRLCDGGRRGGCVGEISDEGLDPSAATASVIGCFRESRCLAVYQQRFRSFSLDGMIGKIRRGSRWPIPSKAVYTLVNNASPLSQGRAPGASSGNKCVATRAIKNAPNCEFSAKAESWIGAPSKAPIATR